MVASRPETEWDDTERAWMLALKEYRRDLLCECGCGFPKAISQAPETEFGIQVPPPTRCHIRTALAAEQKAAEDRPTPEGLLWSVQLAPQSLGA